MFFHPSFETLFSIRGFHILEVVFAVVGSCFVEHFINASFLECAL